MNFAWGNASEFFAMGGYGLYVWGSFGVAALIVAAELATLRARRSALTRHGEDDELSEQNDSGDLQT